MLLIDGALMEADLIKRLQLEFFRRNLAGCAFAALAAKEPERYGWYQRVVEAASSAIEGELGAAIDDKRVTMISLIFPRVRSAPDLFALCHDMSECGNIVLEQDVIFRNSRCLGFRLRVGPALSWITGFGNFGFLPETRRTPYTEITVRTKPRPDYEWTMKEAPEQTIHLADMDMLGLPRVQFEKLWRRSLAHTSQRLGHPPDLRSAAKTTFALPI